MDSSTVLQIEQVVGATAKRQRNSLDRRLRNVLHSHSIEVVGHLIVVSHGSTLYDGLNGATFIYDLKANRWSSPEISGDGPRSRRTASLTLVGDSMYLVGGRVMPRTGLSDVWRLDLVLHVWEECRLFGEKLPDTSGHQVAYFESRRQLLLVSVGTDLLPLGSRTVKAVNMETMTLETPRIKGTHPVLLPYASTCATNDAVFIFGGKLFGSTPHSSNELDILNVDPFGLSWTKPRPTGQVPERRRSAQMNYYHGRLLLFGGRDDVRYMREAYMYDIEQDEWSLMEHEGFEEPLAGHQSVVVDGRIFMIAGEHGPMGARRNCRNVLILSESERRAKNTAKQTSWWKKTLR